MSQVDGEHGSESAGGGPRKWRVRTPMPGERVLEEARSMSRRGKLPGFVEGGDEGRAGELFRCAAFGRPFDSELVVRAEDSPGGGCALTGEVRLKPALPWVFGVVTALTVWPGVVLMDSLMNSWFRWYPVETWVTYAWYVPLTVLPLPWVVRRVVRQSRESAWGHALETREKIAKRVGEVG
ncbi:MAG: hypothetical protein ACF8Q5_06305 [Phycisphaerales bacterium JB040]